MTIYRIRSAVLRAAGHKIESEDKRYAEQRLAEIQQRDPQAKLITVVPR